MCSQPYSIWNPVSRIREDRDFFVDLIQLGLPIALQNLISTALNLVDTLMIGRLGETSIAAVGLSNQIFFLLMLFLFGVSGGTAVFTAQFWGKKDRSGVHRALGIALLLAGVGTAVITSVVQLRPLQILGFFTNDTAVISEAIPYLKITSASYLFTAGTIVYQGILRSVGIVRLPLFLSAGALSVNAFLNYVLIFGKLGFPTLGITGAALATAGARTLEMFILLFLVYAKKTPLAASLKQLKDLKKAFLKRYLWKVFPVILNEVGWATGVTMFTLIYARIGTSVLAAYNITDTFSHLAFVLFVGSANAAAIVLGNMIGKGERFRAERCARTLLMVVPLAAAFFSLLIFLGAPGIPLLFKVSHQAKGLITSFLRILALVFFIKASNLHIIVGILRGGGDTHVCMMNELIPLWLISIPLTAFCGLYLHLPPVLVYSVALTEELTKYPTGLHRILKGNWVHDLTG